MGNKGVISKQTRNNWFVDLGLFLSAVIASLSGIYFLYLPIGGYKGGRNPTYSIEILFERHTWEDIHKWAGILMIAIALIHIPAALELAREHDQAHITGRSSNGDRL
jgi:hypothetical protein